MNGSSPTRKWIVRTVTSLTGFAIMWATTGSWDTEETVAMITIVSAAIISYLVPNTEDNNGIPHSSKRLS